MEVELQEIHDFVAAVPPFDLLSDDELNQLVRKVGIRYLRRGKALPPEIDFPESFYIIRQGAVSLYGAADELLGMLAEGELVTVFCSDDKDLVSRVSVNEDALLYVISCKELIDVVADHPHVMAFLLHTSQRRLSKAVRTSQRELAQTDTLMNMPLASLLGGKAVKIEQGASIEAAAEKMTEHGVSSLLIMKQDQLSGIITDRDMRSRCLAKGLSPSEPVKSIMTPDPVSVRSDAMAFDALMQMTQKNIHHLPVIDSGQVLGLVTATDLIKQEGKNAVYINRSVHRAESVEELAEISCLIPDLQMQLFSSGGSAEHVGRAITAVSDAITRRLIEMAEEKLGAPPAPYAWIAAGSQARREQSSHSDQDNGMIISDSMQAGDDKWFADLANFVCDGLDACGFIYCPGDAMAKNPQWRQKVSVWKGYFKRWIQQPEPKALMLSSIFFDIRVIYGDKGLLKSIQEETINMSKHSQFFLSHMTVNALTHRPPLGFFRDFVLLNDDEHKDTLDLKHTGIVPIIDLARIYALAEGISAVNTVERLKLASGTHSLSKDGAENLLDAYEFISRLRMEHQVAQIRSGEKADNYVSPRQLSRLERTHLKDAFKVVQAMQEALAHRYHTGQIS